MFGILSVNLVCSSGAFNMHAFLFSCDFNFFLFSIVKHLKERKEMTLHLLGGFVHVIFCIYPYIGQV